MPFYNREEYISQAIESVLNQTEKNFELILWNDGSTDNSLNIAKKYAKEDLRIKLYSSEHRLGVGLITKKVYDKGKGKYICQVDSDDWIDKTCFEKTKNILEENDSTGFVYTNYINIDQKGEIKNTGYKINTPYSKENLLLVFMTFHFRLIKKYYYDLVGGVNTKFTAANDYELCLRLSEVTNAICLNEPLYYYRQHKNSVSSQNKKKQTYYARLARKEAKERRQN